MHKQNLCDSGHETERSELTPPRGKDQRGRRKPAFRPAVTTDDVLPWTCWSEGEITEQTLWRAKQPSQVACFLEDLKHWGAWDTTCGHKAKDITPPIARKREAWKEEALDDLPWKDETGPSSIRWILEPFQRQHWGNLWETGWSAYGLFQAHRYHLELN